MNFLELGLLDLKPKPDVLSKVVFEFEKKNFGAKKEIQMQFILESIIIIDKLDQIHCFYSKRKPIQSTVTAQRI